MSRIIEIEFPEVGIKVDAALLEKKEPELSDMFWDKLANPLKTACYNTLSTGHLFIAKPRPPKSPVKIGTQANPVGRNKVLLCDMEPGNIVYTGLDVWVAYGDHITEPLVPGGSVVAQVEEKFIEDFERAGMAIWNAQYVTHKLITMNIKRKEN